MDQQEVSMDVELLRVPRRTEKINVLTGVFVKTVYLLSDSKCFITGFFKDRGDALGVLFTAGKVNVYWPHDVFNQFNAIFNDVTVALENRKRYFFKIDTGEYTAVVNHFGKMYVHVNDGGKVTLALRHDEWTQFTNNLPLVYRSLRECFLYESSVQQYIKDILTTGEEQDIPIAPLELPTLIADRLYDELQLYKRLPNGRCG